MSNNQINDSLIMYDCTFQGHFQKAKVNLKFPCSFFIQWKSIDGKNSVRTQKSYKSNNAIILFDQTLQFRTQLIWDEIQMKYKKKSSHIKLNLISASRPDEVKLVGQLCINLIQIASMLSQQFISKQLIYCSVGAQLTFSIKLVSKKQSIAQTNDISLSSLNIRTNYSHAQTQRFSKIKQQDRSIIKDNKSQQENICVSHAKSIQDLQLKLRSFYIEESKTKSQNELTQYKLTSEYQKQINKLKNQIQMQNSKIDNFNSQIVLLKKQIVQKQVNLQELIQQNLYIKQNAIQQKQYHQQQIKILLNEAQQLHLIIQKQQNEMKSQQKEIKLQQNEIKIQSYKNQSVIKQIKQYQQKVLNLEQTIQGQSNFIFQLNQNFKILQNQFNQQISGFNQSNEDFQTKIKQLQAIIQQYKSQQDKFDTKKLICVQSQCQPQELQLYPNNKQIELNQIEFKICDLKTTRLKTQLKIQSKTELNENLNLGQNNFELQIQKVKYVQLLSQQDLQKLINLINQLKQELYILNSQKCKYQQSQKSNYQQSSKRNYQQSQHKNSQTNYQFNEYQQEQLRMKEVDYIGSQDQHQQLQIHKNDYILETTEINYQRFHYPTQSCKIDQVIIQDQNQFKIRINQVSSVDTSLQNEFNYIVQQKITQKTRILDLQSKIAELVSQNIQKIKTIQSLNITISQLNKNIQILIQKKKQLQDKIQDDSYKLKNIEKQNLQKNYQQQQKLLNLTILTLQQELAQLKQEVQTKNNILYQMQQFVKQSYDLKFQLADLKDKTAELQQIIASKDKQINGLDEIIYHLQNIQSAHVKDQTQKNIQTIKQTKELYKNIQQLKVTIQQLQTDKKNLNQQNQLLNEDLKNMNNELIYYYQQNLSYKQKLRDTKDQNQSLKDQLYLYQKFDNRINSNVHKLKDNLTTLPDILEQSNSIDHKQQNSINRQQQNSINHKQENLINQRQQNSKNQKQENSINQKQEHNQIKVQLEILRQQLLSQNKQCQFLRQINTNLNQELMQLKFQLNQGLNFKVNQELTQLNVKLIQSGQLIKSTNIYNLQLSKQNDILKTKYKSLQLDYKQYRDIYQQKVNQWFLNKDDCESQNMQNKIQIKLLNQKLDQLTRQLESSLQQNKQLLKNKEIVIFENKQTQLLKGQLQLLNQQFELIQKQNEQLKYKVEKTNTQINYLTSTNQQLIQQNQNKKLMIKQTKLDFQQMELQASKLMSYLQQQQQKIADLEFNNRNLLKHINSLQLQLQYMTEKMKNQQKELTLLNLNNQVQDNIGFKRQVHLLQLQRINLQLLITNKQLVQSLKQMNQLKQRLATIQLYKIQPAQSLTLINDNKKVQPSEDVQNRKIMKVIVILKQVIKERILEKNEFLFNHRQSTQILVKFDQILLKKDKILIEFQKLKSSLLNIQNINKQQKISFIKAIKVLQNLLYQFVMNIQAANLNI